MKNSKISRSLALVKSILHLLEKSSHQFISLQQLLDPRVHLVSLPVRQHFFGFETDSFPFLIF